MTLCSISYTSSLIQVVSDQSILQSVIEGRLHSLILNVDEIKKSVNVFRRTDLLLTLTGKTLLLLESDESTTTNVILSEELDAFCCGVDGVDDNVVQRAAGSGHRNVKFCVDCTEVTLNYDKYMSYV